MLYWQCILSCLRFLDSIQSTNYTTSKYQGVLIVQRIVICDAWRAALYEEAIRHNASCKNTNKYVLTVKICTTKVLGTHFLTNGCLDKWRPAKENGALFSDNNTFVRHGWNVGTACSTRSQYSCDLWNTLCRHVGLYATPVCQLHRTKRPKYCLPDYKRYVQSVLGQEKRLPDVGDWLHQSPLVYRTVSKKPPMTSAFSFSL